MTQTRSFLDSYCIPIILTVWLVSGTKSNIECEQENESFAKCKEEFANYRDRALEAVKRIFDEDQTCSAAREDTLRAELKETRRRLEQLAMEFEPKIYFAAWEGGVRAYSGLNSEAKTVVNSSERIIGIVYDSIRDKIYWSTPSTCRIYRANLDGTGVETVLDTNQYGGFQGLAFDWITGNLYAGTQGGYLLVCDTATAPALKCLPVISGHFDVEGVAVSPLIGKLYYTRHSHSSGGSVWTAETDGSNPSEIVRGLRGPRGIVIDLKMSRIYWADEVTKRIQSSDLDGRNSRTVIQLSDGGPIGIALFGDKIFWANWGNKKLQSVGMKARGTDLRTLHIDTLPLQYLTLAPDIIGHPQNRKNHCKGQMCSNICVLTATSFKCVN